MLHKTVGLLSAMLFLVGTPTPVQQQQQQGQGNKGKSSGVRRDFRIYLNGTVVQEDASYFTVREELEKAVRLNPDYAPVWYLLGRAQLGLEDAAAALESFQKAISVDASYISPYIELSRLAVAGGEWSRAAELTDRVTEMDPTVHQNRYFQGLAHYHLGQFEIAEQCFRFLEQGGHWRTYPTTYFYLGMMDARKGDIAAAVEDFRNCLKYAPEAMVSSELREGMAQQLKIWEQELAEQETPVSLPKHDAVGEVKVAGHKGFEIENQGAGHGDGGEQEPHIIWIGKRPIRMVVTTVPAGILIQKVVWMGGAWVAGLRKGDVVIWLNGEKPDRLRFGDMFLLISRGEAAQGVFTVRRGDEELTFEVRRFAGQIAK